ncbi:hypothetical protein HWV62_34623 [Athelia sp. TMB]|nr:hypothetical protein HWV62_34623 [Athelia sp. TMB]
MNANREQSKVIIIGASLGGLTLARSLARKLISFEIYDAHPANISRDSGWALTLHTALPHLRALFSHTNANEILDKISVCAGSGQPDQFVFYDGRTADLLSAGSADTLDFVRANRGRLLDWLAEGVNVKWGCTYAGHEVHNGAFTVYFTDGSSTQGHILVGCDGIDSRVRTMVYRNLSAPFAPQPQLHNLPIGAIGGSVMLTPVQYARQSLLARSLYIAHGDAGDPNYPNLRLLVGLNSYAPDLSWAEYHWLLCYRIPASSSPGGTWMNGATSERQLAWARGAVRGMHYDLCEVIFRTRPERMFTPFVIRDRVPEVLEGAGPITLIGDAAHPMSFFNGDGGNAAILDAVCLAERLSLARFSPAGPPAWAASSAGSVAGGAAASGWNEYATVSALRAFEGDMLARVGPMVKEAREATCRAGSQ